MSVEKSREKRAPGKKGLMRLEQCKQEEIQVASKYYNTYLFDHTTNERNAT